MLFRCDSSCGVSVGLSSIATHGHKSKSGASDFATFAKNQNTIFMLNIPLLDAYLVYLCHTYLFNHLISIFMLYIPLLDIIWFRRRWQKKGPFRTPDFDSCPCTSTSRVTTCFLS